MPAMQRPGKRHYLLLYARQFARWRAAAFLIALVCGVLWWFSPLVPPLSTPVMQMVLLIGAVAGALLLLYCLIAPRLAYIQCFPKFMRINAPFFSVVLSYSRIRSVRPLQFTPRRKPTGGQYALLKPFLGQTIVALDLFSYPLAERWLRFGLQRYMFPDDFTGLQFHVKDWMALSGEIDSYRSVQKVSQVDTPSINPFSYH